MENAKLAEFIANEVTKAIQNYDFDSIIQEVFEKNHENPETSGRWFYELLAPVIQEHIALYHVRGRHNIPNG